MDSKIEIRLIGYYSSNSTFLKPELERIEEAQELATLLRQSLSSLKENNRVDVSFINVLEGNTVFIFKTRGGELIAYHTTTGQARLSNVTYNKDVVTPVTTNYKKWFVPGEPIFIKKAQTQEINVDISDLSKVSDEKWWEKYEVITGTVQHVTHFGAFVDFDNKTGLIHKSNLTWETIEHPGEILRHGDIINAVIIDVDSEDKVQLGYKQLHKRRSSLKYGDIVVGYVTQVLPNAYLIQINDYKAILPFSESICKKLTESDLIVGKIIKNEWNAEKHRNDTVVSQRSFHDDFANSHNVGDIVNLKIVKSVNNNGSPFALVRRGNLYALIPLKHLSEFYRNRLSDESWTEELAPFVYTGQNASTRIVSFDMRPIEKARKKIEQKRIQEERKAALKAAREKRQECVELITSNLNPDTVIEVIVAKVTKDGVLVNITEELSEYIPKDELSADKVISAEDEVFEGEPISVVYKGTKEDKIILSRKMISESKYSNDLYEKSLEYLLLTMGITTNKFVGKVIDINGLYFLTDLMVVSKPGSSDNGKLLVDPITGLRIRAFIEPKLHHLFFVGDYYNVSLDLAFTGSRRRECRPYMFCVNDANIEDAENPYERIVCQSFKKQTSPSSNSSLANLLETVGQGLYSSKRRMFFELLQNADDCAAESGVQVKFELSDTHFILTHNGMPFSKQDFDSIISAAKSTKSANKKKTGYKGIGFKSVFTNSTEVTIFSGGFKFAFNKKLPLYNDFKGFYFLINDCEGNPTEQKNFLERFEAEFRDFRGVKDIPWQLLPIWQEQRSDDLRGSIFTEIPNVAIALRMDKTMLEEYHIALTEILQHPKFMLFMRSTNRIQYKDGKRYYSVKKIADQSGNITLLNSVIENCPRETFHIENSGYIPVNNEAFSSAGVLIIRSKKTNNAGIEETIFAHINEKHEILSEINDIPDRLASAENIEISFAVKTDAEGEVIPLSTTSSNLDSCFYSYLPMNEQRFKLPMYVNADFDLHSDREGVKADSPWNVFLFYHIGRRLVQAVSNIASTSQKDYLNLLLANSFDESNQETAKLSQAFNRGYREGIKEIPFIINDKGDKVLAQNIILDKSGLSSDVSNDLFYRLFKLDKRQPNIGIDSSILNNDIFEIQSIDIEEAIRSIVVNNALLQEWIDAANVDKRERLLDWLHRNNAPETLVKQLRLITVNGSLFSIEQLLSSEKYVVLSSDDTDVQAALNSLGLGTLVIAKDNILRGYFNQSNQQAFDIISNRLSQIRENQAVQDETAQPNIKERVLSVVDKLQIVRYLDGLSNIGPKAISSILLFNNVKNLPTALCKMVAFRQFAPKFMEDFMISEEDNIPEIQKYLVTSEDEFDKVIWTNRHTIGLTSSELLSYNTTDSETYLITLIEEALSNEDLYGLIDNAYIASDKVKYKFLEKVFEFSLNDQEPYDETSFESKVITLAISTLEEPSTFAYKILYKGKRVTEYSLDEDVICKYKQGDTERTVKIPLVKLLPEYANNTLGIHCLKTLFEESKGFDKLLKTHQKPLCEVYDELNKLLSLPAGEFPVWPNGKGNGIQYLFISFYRKQMKGWYNRYIPDIALENQKDDFVKDILYFLYNNNIYVGASPFTYHLSRYFKGKYFADSMVSKSETLISIIGTWANSDEKKQKYLLDNGVKDRTANEIKFRRMLCENQLIDFFDNLHPSDINTGLSFICSYANLTFPLKGENQINTIKLLYTKPGVGLTKSINLQKLASLSIECNTPEYESWVQTHYPHIYLYDGNMPYFIDCGNVHIGELDADERFYYDNNSKKLYINSNEELPDLLFSVARKSGIPFDMDDYRILCMEGKISVSKDELKAKNDEIQSLKSRVEELERLLNISSVYYGTSSTALSKKDQYAALIEAQQALIEKRGDWRFPVGFGERNEDGTPMCYSLVTVQNENGEDTEIVLKSYKKTDEHFHINPEEWDAVVKRGATLLVYTPFYGQLDIVNIPKDELVRKQSSIQISFSTSNLDEQKYPHKISEFASILHYFQQITFDFERFHISKDAVRVTDISVKHDLNVTPADDNDI